MGMSLVILTASEASVVLNFNAKSDFSKFISRLLNAIKTWLYQLKQKQTAFGLARSTPQIGISDWRNIRGNFAKAKRDFATFLITNTLQ
jgi:hypothetical protein